jgi:hypothetical protein
MNAPSIEVLMGVADLAGEWVVTGPHEDDEVATFMSRHDALAHAAERAAVCGQAVMFHIDAEY